MNESKPEVRANDCTIGMAGLWLHNGASKLERHKNSFTFFSSVFHVFMRPPPIPLDVSRFLPTDIPKTYPNSWPSLY